MNRPQTSSSCGFNQLCTCKYAASAKIPNSRGAATATSPSVSFQGQFGTFTTRYVRSTSNVQFLQCIHYTSPPISATITTISTSPLPLEVVTLRQWRDRGSGDDGCKSRNRTTTTSAWSAAAGCPSTGCPVSGWITVQYQYHTTATEACIALHTAPSLSTCRDSSTPDCSDRTSKRTWQAAKNLPVCLM